MVEEDKVNRLIMKEEVYSSNTPSKEKTEAHRKAKITATSNNITNTITAITEEAITPNTTNNNSIKTRIKTI